MCTHPRERERESIPAISVPRRKPPGLSVPQVTKSNLISTAFQGPFLTCPKLRLLTPTPASLTVYFDCIILTDFFKKDDTSPSPHLF